MKKVDLEQLILEEQRKQEESPLRDFTALLFWLSNIDREIIPAVELFNVYLEICSDSAEVWHGCNIITSVYCSISRERIDWFLGNNETKVYYFTHLGEYYTKDLKKAVVQLLQEQS